MSSYLLLIGLGALAGYWQVRRLAPTWHASIYKSAGLSVILSALVGARLLGVVFNWASYNEDPVGMLQPWDGVLSWVGALAGAVLAVLRISRKTRISWRVLADGLSPMLVPVSVLAWMGCWQASCAFGASVPAAMLARLGLPWWQGGGAELVRIPLQPMAAATLLILFAWVESRRKHFLEPGMRASAYGLALSLHLLAFSLLRGDPTPLWLGLRPETWAAAGFCLLFGWGVQCCSREKVKPLIP